MPYKVQSTKPNRTVVVSISKGGEESTVKLRGAAAAYSDIITADMRTQVKLKYITCKMVKESSQDETVSDRGQSAVMAAVDQRNAEMTGEANDPPSKTKKYFAEDDIMSLKKSQLQSLAEMYPEMEIDPKQTKDELRDALLAFDVPWVDPSEL